MTRTATHFDAMGGEPVLRPLINQFVDRMFDDSMIGFLFRKANRERIKAMEYEHAAEHLGSGDVYTGRPLPAAHRAHRIAGGQFERRFTILKQLLVECAVPPEVQKAWLQEVTRLRSEITSDAHGDCVIGLPSATLAADSTKKVLPLRLASDAPGKK